MADSIATAADYADAIMTARRAKNTLFLLLLLILLAQLALFFLGRNDVVNIEGNGTVATGVAVSSAATQPTTADSSTVRFRTRDVLEYLVGVTAFLGIALTLVLAVVLLLIVKIMLVGRLIGVSRLTSAFIWTVVLATLLFPWQAFWADYDFKLPGALYTWNELVARVKQQPQRDAAVLFWARFVAFPVLALIILLAIQIKSRRGLQQALGEAHYDATTAPLA
jgi:hypothetical protein